MKKNFLLLSLFPALLSAQSFEWGRTFGGSQNDNAQRMAVTSSGDVVVAGNFLGPGTFGTNTLNGYGFQDVYVAKYAPNGTLLWAQAFGGSGNDQVSALGLDGNGNVLVSGRFTGNFYPNPADNSQVINSQPSNGLDGFFIRLEGQTGALDSAFDVSAGGIMDIRSILWDETNAALYLGGQYSGTMDFDFGTGTVSRSSNVLSVDGFVGRYDASLGISWVNTFGSATPTIDYVSAMAVDDAGGIYCTGLFGGTVDIDPGASTFNLTCATDAYLIRYQAGTGALDWGFNLGGNSIEFGTALLVTPDNTVVLAGSMNSASMDVNPGPGNTTLSSGGIAAVPFLLRYTSAAAYVNGMVLSGQSGLTATFSALAYSPENQVVVGGSFAGTCSFATADTAIELVSNGSANDGMILFLDDANLALNSLHISGASDQTLSELRFSGALLSVCGQLTNATSPGTPETPDVVPANTTSEGFLFRYNMSPTAIQAAVKVASAKQVFPNPASTILNFPAYQPQAYALYHTDGRLIQHGQASQIAVDALPNGIYFLQLSDDSGFTTHRICVSH